MHASLAVRLEPVAREAEIRPLAVDLHAEHAAVEVLGALEVLRYEQEVIQFGDGHGNLLVAMILTVPRLLPLLLWLFIAPAVAQSFEPYEGQPGKDVVWVPTRHALVERMLDLATVTERDFVVDLGSGDGRMVIAAAKRGARALGVEYEPEMVALARRHGAAAGVAERAQFVQGDMFQADFSQATVLALFLLPANLRRLTPKFLDLTPGTRIVSNSYRIEGWEEETYAEIGGECFAWCTAYLYIVPANVAGAWRLPAGVMHFT